MVKTNRISTKLIIVLLTTNFIIGIGIIIFIHNFTLRYLTREIEKKGASIGRNLAEWSIELILMDDRVKLQKLIKQIKETEKDIYYIFIVNQHKELLVHTFGEYFPKGLAEINPVKNQSYSVELISTEVGLIRDISIPILNGLLGTIHIGLSEKHTKKFIFSIILKLIIALFIMTTLSMFLTFLFTQKILFPLNHLINAIKKVGQGEMNQELKIKTKDEIGLAIQTFNEMTHRLKKANMELNRAQLQLIQASKMATIGQFSSAIAHEINNPLAGILNCVRTLLANPEIKGENRGYLELILKGLIRIENTIRQILTFSGPQKLEAKLINIDKLLEETLSFIKPFLDEKKINLKKNLSTENSFTFGDPNLLKIAFLNILNNSLDALPNHGQLIVETKILNQSIEIKFIDNGSGIKKQYLDKIFEPFFTTKEPGKGTGLGLYLTYNFIQQHRGTIEVKSEEGKGTTVIIKLPKEK
ncbi:MAG: HAMP domain-containing histidine kinase [Candidatus Omnitrophica bacterium]|nr:HAMP domain-containing histidine kinase [Candidatus Omnitrophota bacterium]